MFLIKLIPRQRNEISSRIYELIKPIRRLPFQFKQNTILFNQKYSFSSFNQFQQYKFSSSSNQPQSNEEGDAASKFYQMNQILIEQEKYDEVLHNWNEVKVNQTIQGIPQEECDYEIARVYLLKGEIKQSMDLFEDYVKRIKNLNIYSDQNVADEIFQIAQEFQQERHFEESISFYEESLKMNQDNKEIHLQYIDNLIRNMNKNDLAIDHIYKIINHNKFYTPMLFQLLGEAYFNKREFAQSIDYYLKYLEVLLANISKQSTTQEEATNLVLKNENMEVAAVFLKIASSYYFIKNYEKSLDYYLKNYQFQMEHQFDISHQMFLNISELYLKMQKFDKGLEILQVGSDKYPEMVEFQYLQGMINLNFLRDIKKAQHAFEKAIQINPKHSDSFKQLGLIYLRQQNFDQAEEMFLKCISIYHNDTDSLYYMAYILQYHHKSPKDALICYQLCLDVNPLLPAPLMQSAIIHYDLTNYDKALEFITKAHQSDPESEQINFLYEKFKTHQNSTV